MVSDNVNNLTLHRILDRLEDHTVCTYGTELFGEQFLGIKVVNISNLGYKLPIAPPNSYCG